MSDRPASLSGQRLRVTVERWQEVRRDHRVEETALIALEQRNRRYLASA
ncbi:MAG: hypothetical protein KY462_11455 [Actinobacteria bacterium]|nr:hypothetical protein [Actinomycetota bacterium]